MRKFHELMLFSGYAEDDQGLRCLSEFNTAPFDGPRAVLDSNRSPSIKAADEIRFDEVYENPFMGSTP